MRPVTPDDRVNVLAFEANLVQGVTRYLEDDFIPLRRDAVMGASKRVYDKLILLLHYHSALLSRHKYIIGVHNQFTIDTEVRATGWPNIRHQE